MKRETHTLDMSYTPPLFGTTVHVCDSVSHLYLTNRPRSLSTLDASKASKLTFELGFFFSMQHTTWPESNYSILCCIVSFGVNKFSMGQSHDGTQGLGCRKRASVDLTGSACFMLMPLSLVELWSVTWNVSFLYWLWTLYRGTDRPKQLLEHSLISNRPL